MVQQFSKGGKGVGWSYWSYRFRQLYDSVVAFEHWLPSMRGLLGHGWQFPIGCYGVRAAMECRTDGKAPGNRAGGSCMVYAGSNIWPRFVLAKAASFVGAGTLRKGLVLWG